MIVSEGSKNEIFDLLHKISDAKIDCDLKLVERWLRRKSQNWWKVAQSSLSSYL